MSDTPRISVIMPIHNGAALIERVVPSIRGQTFQDFELIIVDDGSTDDLAGALARHPDSRIRLIRLAVNQGAAGARNAGIREARGEYLAFVDCDDEWLPDKLRRQLSSLEASPRDLGVAITGYYVMRDRLGRREARPLQDEPDWYRRLLAGCNVSFGSCALVRRASFDEIGYFDESLRRLEDWDWLLRYTARWPIANVEEPLAIIHTGTKWPSVNMVEQSCRQIWARHSGAAARHSQAAQKLLLSTIAYERAAALYHEHRPARALWPALRATLLYPDRGRDFYRHLLQRLGDAIHGRFG